MNEELKQKIIDEAIQDAVWLECVMVDHAEYSEDRQLLLEIAKLLRDFADDYSKRLEV